MPYIKQEDRQKFNYLIKELIEKIEDLDEKDVDGSLNYIFTKIIKSVYKPKYFNYNRAIGMLECVKQELYRRVIGPYENIKEQENGDV